MLHFIVNPSARSGLGKSVWENTRQRLSGSQTPYQVHFTEGPHHATELVSKITGDGRSHTLVVLGGDGSIDEAVNGIRYSGKTTLGYIPFGSGNDFARGLGYRKYRVIVKELYGQSMERLFSDKLLR